MAGVDRESWDSYFIRMAEMVGTRSTCPRRHVGAVLVQDRRVRGTAYNGAPTRQPDCVQSGCLFDEHGRCRRALHAESNVLDQTTPEEQRAAVVYVTDRPCFSCAQRLANSEISEVIFLRPHDRDLQLVTEMMRLRGIRFRQYEPAGSLDRPAETTSRPAERRGAGGVVAKALCRDDHGRVLLVRRGDDDPVLPGVWELPGGRVRAGSDEAAVIDRALTCVGGARSVGGVRLRRDAAAGGQSVAFAVYDAVPATLSHSVLDETFLWADPADLPSPVSEITLAALRT